MEILAQIGPKLPEWGSVRQKWFYWGLNRPKNVPNPGLSMPRMAQIRFRYAKKGPTIAQICQDGPNRAQMGLK